MAMSDVNLSIVMGNLVRDCELEYIGEKKTPFCQATIVSNYSKGDYSDVCFQRIAVYGRTAELLAREGHKGKKIQVTGRLRSPQGGDTNRPNELVVDDLKFFGVSPNRNGSSEGSYNDELIEG